jgi:DNA-binding IclR family transcriptional regulator
VIDAVTGATMRRFTGATPNAGTLPGRLAHIREHGFALSRGEVDASMVGVAAPAFRGRLCVCGLSVAGPDIRLRGAELDGGIQAVLAAARDLGAALESVSGAAAWVPAEATS